MKEHEQFQNLGRCLVDRRRFLGTSTGAAAALPAYLLRGVGGAGALATGGMVCLPNHLMADEARSNASPSDQSQPDYQGPNIVLIRFGGGCRRREAIETGASTFAPFLYHQLIPQGTLFENVFISTDAKDTGHGQGTLNILVGRYDQYEDVSNGFLQERFEAQAATLFEYLRSAYSIPTHQALIINGEDRTQEEFYTFSNHHLFGVNYRSSVLSLYRFKTYLLTKQIEEQKQYLAGVKKPRPNETVWNAQKLDEQQKELHKLESLDERRVGESGQAAQIEEFWTKWRAYYGDSGLLNPRGDSVLTELAVRSMRELQPKLIMVNYNDCDYVHWGNIHHYHRAITIMDEGIKRIVETADQLPQYKNNTIFVIVPDCGRDDSRLAAVPCQHHFNSKSSRQIFALLVGPGIEKSRRVDRLTQQIDIAPTIAQLMGFSEILVRNGNHRVEGRVLEEALA